MKRLFYFLIVLSCTLWSCGKSDSDVDNPNNPDNPDNPTHVTLNISTTDLTFEANGGQKEFTIYCNSDWTITNNSNWCKTDVTNGNGDKTITVTTDPYSETEDQNTNLTIKAGDKTKVLTVTQKHADAIILTKDKFDVPQEGENITIEVKSNIEYQVSIPSKFQTWIKQAVRSKALETKTFSFTISANENFDKREGYIVFNGNSLKDTVYIFQAQKNQLILTEDTYNIPSEGKDITVELKTNIDYEVNIPNEATSWLSQITTRAIRTDQLKFHIDFNKGANNRSAKVVIKDKNSDLSDTIYISQLPLGEIKLSPKVFNIEAVGDDISTILTTNVDYEVLIPYQYQDWITKLEAEITQIIKLKFKIAANTTTNKRTGKIVIKDKNSILSDTITINQLAEENTYWKDIEFKNTQEIQKFIQKGYTRIQGNVTINDRYTTTLAAFADALEYISGTLEINCPELTAINGLSGLKEIGSLYIHDCKIQNLQGLNGLKEIKKHFTLREIWNGSRIFDSLISFEGLENLEKIGGDFTLSAYSRHPSTYSVYAFNSLKSFKGLEKLSYIGGTLLLYCDAGKTNAFETLDSFEGLNNLQTLGGLELYGCGFKVLNSLPKLNNIQTISGNVKLTISSPNFTTLTGLDNLQSIGGNLDINCDYLQSIEALKNLTTIGRNLSIRNLDAVLNSLKGLENLTSIGNNLAICLNGDATLEVLKNLHTLKGKLEVLYIKAKSLQGLENLKSLGGLYIDTDLPSLKGLDNILEIKGDVTISQYANLSSFNGLNNLKIIEGSLTIITGSRTSHSLQSFQGLNELTTIGGSLYIGGCEILEKLEGLEKLETVSGDLTITSCSTLQDINTLTTLKNIKGGKFTINNCPALYDFTSLKNALTDYKGIFELTNNGYNPTKYQILNGQGKPQE